jgi:endonuclease/exonuclease/phosphatase family metal-dependent hydrolase
MQSDTPDVIPSNTWSLEYLRAAVLGRFTDIESAQVVCMLNTHYDITRGQNQSSELVARLLGDFCANGDGVIMTGDLNALPESPAVRYLVGEGSIDGSISSLPLFDTLTAAGEGGGTWIGGSFNGNITGGKIDYILTPVNGQVCLQSAKIINDTYGGFACSDHAAVQSSLCIGSGCSACLS